MRQTTDTQLLVKADPETLLDARASGELPNKVSLRELADPWPYKRIPSQRLLQNSPWSVDEVLGQQAGPWAQVCARVQDLMGLPGTQALDSHALEPLAVRAKNMGRIVSTSLLESGRNLDPAGILIESCASFIAGRLRARDLRREAGREVPLAYAVQEFIKPFPDFLVPTAIGALFHSKALYFGDNFACQVDSKQGEMLGNLHKNAQGLSAFARSDVSPALLQAVLCELVFHSSYKFREVLTRMRLEPISIAPSSGGLRTTPQNILELSAGSVFSRARATAWGLKANEFDPKPRPLHRPPRLS